MDLHERYVHFPTADLEILELLETSFKNEPLALLHRLVRHYNEEIAMARLDLKKLETFRMILCYEYQLIFDSQRRYETERWKHTCLQGVGHVLVTGKQPHFSSHITILYDIAILQMMLYCNLQCIEQHLTNFRESTNHDYADSKEARYFYMKMLECFLDTFRLRMYLSKTEDSHISESIIHLYQENISSWLQIKEEKEWRLFASLFRKLVDTSVPTNVLLSIYDVVLHNLEDLKDSLTALSIMIEACFPLNMKDINDIHYSLYYTEQLWSLIIEGLKSPIQQYQKQALFVMKRITDVLNKVNRNQITDAKFTLVPFLCTNSAEMQSLVNNMKEKFFLILEALQEKQYHLVAPALTHLPCLIKCCQELAANNNSFNIIWLQLVFERILRHENSTIVKQGILYICDFNPNILDNTFLTLFVNILNNSFLYECEFGKQEPTILNDLTTLFIRAIKAEAAFSKRLLKAINKVAWGPIPLFYMMEILQIVSIKTAKCILETEDLQTIKCLVQKHLSVHSQILRIASQVALMRTIINSLKTIDDLTLVLNTLYEFPHEEALGPETFSWNLVTKWLKAVLTKEDAVCFVQQTCENFMHQCTDREICAQKFAFAILILHDAEKILHKSCPTYKILDNWLSSLNGIDVRPYADIKLSIDIMDFMSHLLNLSTPRNEQNICRLLLPYIDISMQFLLKNLKSMPLKLKYEEIQKYLHILTTFLSNKSRLMLKKQTFDYIEKFQNESIFILNNINQYEIMHYLCALHILHFTQCTLNATYSIEILLNIPKLKQFDGNKQDEISRTRVVSDCYLLITKLIHQYISEKGFDIYSQNVEWFQSISQMYEMGGKEVIPVIASILKTVVDKKGITDVHDRSNFESIFGMCWRSMFLDKRNKLFLFTIKNLVNSIINDNFIVLRNALNFTSQYLDQLLEEGDNMPKLKKCLLSAMEQLDLQYLVNFQMILVSCLLHGYALRKDKKIENEAYLYIAKHFKTNFPEHISIIDNNNDTAIRAHAAILLHKIISINAEYTSSFLSLMLEELEKYRNKRYYNHSHVHKIKHRVMQTLLILQPSLNEKDSILLAERIFDLIILESNQHSVRLMQEWILIRIFIKNTNLHYILWESYEKAIKTRPGCTSSMASIVCHIAYCLPNVVQSDFVYLGLKYITQCCLGQQFNMRLYNQVVFVKLYKLLEHKNSDIISKYKGLYEAVVENLLEGSLMKNSAKVQDDFYLTIFHPINDYSLQTVYFELPRLSDIDVNEWIDPDLFQKLNFKATNQPLQLYNFNDSLKKITTSVYQAKSSTGDNKMLRNTMNINTGGFSDIQKKIDPSAVANAGNNVSVSVREAMVQKKLIGANMIVVASLIDRPPNLGGLARTCEIFGIKELVIGNINYTKEKDFQNLSVSADKWITITEVKPYKLHEYMLEKKKTGWSLIGAEQTVNSVYLQNMKFDNKTVLLLGNEKDGIPANLIPLLDTCIEVPQVGVIRSLNVHVTGAICIWQYLIQHVLLETENIERM